jgi:hypothetical protein
MDIIFGKENAEKLREKYTILDLETIEVEPGKNLEVFCLISADKISIGDLPQLEAWVKLHEDFLKGFHKKEYSYCRQCIEHLMGKFAGEVDTFYEEILKRIDIEDPQKSD